MRNKISVELFQAQNHLTFLAAKQLGRELGVMRWGMSKEEPNSPTCNLIELEMLDKSEMFEKHLKLCFPKSPEFWGAVLQSVQLYSDETLRSIGEIR